MKSVIKFLQLTAVAAATTFATPAFAVTDINWWHAMSGQLGRQVEKLAADFNASQSEYRVVPTHKGGYTETVTAAIFAFRSRSQPAIVQVDAHVDWGDVIRGNPDGYGSTMRRAAERQSIW